MKISAAFVFYISLQLTFSSLSYCKTAIIETQSSIWKDRHDSPETASMSFFAHVKNGNYEASFYILDNSVQNLIRAFTSTMDTSSFAKESEYVFSQAEISAIVNNDQVNWHSIIFLYDQLMAVGIQKSKFPLAFNENYIPGDVKYFGKNAYSVVELSSSNQEILVLLKKDSTGNWRLLSITDLKQSFFWPIPSESLWENAIDGKPEGGSRD